LVADIIPELWLLGWYSNYLSGAHRTEQAGDGAVLMRKD
jgi:hypothetical protein